MEIHSPHGTVGSVKDFFVHLLIVVVGILIALSLEGVLEWTHHRRLVHEAQANLAAEIADNQGKIKEALPQLHDNSQQLEKIMSQMRQLEADRKTPIHDIRYTFVVHTLNATSWNTAMSTGAISYMDYPHVRQYTEIYETQKQFLSMRDQALQSYTPLGTLPVVFERDFKKISDAQLQDVESAASIALLNVQSVESVAKELDEQYSNFLGGK
jgi:hypothetical protein